MFCLLHEVDPKDRRNSFKSGVFACAPVRSSEHNTALSRQCIPLHVRNECFRWSLPKRKAGAVVRWCAALEVQNKSFRLMRVSRSGWVQVHGGKLVDLLRMQALAACGECGAGIRLVNLVRGARREANCTSCHAAVSGEGLDCAHTQKKGRMQE